MGLFEVGRRVMAAITSQVMNYVSDGSENKENPLLLSAEIPKLNDSSSQIMTTKGELEEETAPLTDLWIGDSLTEYQNTVESMMAKVILASNVTNNLAGNTKAFVDTEIEHDLESALAASKGGIV